MLAFVLFLVLVTFIILEIALPGFTKLTVNSIYFIVKSLRKKNLDNKPEILCAEFVINDPAALKSFASTESLASEIRSSDPEKCILSDTTFTTTKDTSSYSSGKPSSIHQSDTIYSGYNIRRSQPFQKSHKFHPTNRIATSILNNSNPIEARHTRQRVNGYGYNTIDQDSARQRVFNAHRPRPFYQFPKPVLHLPKYNFMPSFYATNEHFEVVWVKPEVQIQPRTLVTTEEDKGYNKQLVPGLRTRQSNAKSAFDKITNMETLLARQFSEAENTLISMLQSCSEPQGVRLIGLKEEMRRLSADASANIPLARFKNQYNQLEQNFNEFITQFETSIKTIQQNSNTRTLFQQALDLLNDRGGKYSFSAESIWRDLLVLRNALQILDKKYQVIFNPTQAINTSGIESRGFTPTTGTLNNNSVNMVQDLPVPIIQLTMPTPSLATRMTQAAPPPSSLPQTTESASAAAAPSISSLASRMSKAPSAASKFANSANLILPTAAATITSFSQTAPVAAVPAPAVTTAVPISSLQAGINEYNHIADVLRRVRQHCLSFEPSLASHFVSKNPISPLSDTEKHIERSVARATEDFGLTYEELANALRGNWFPWKKKSYKKQAGNMVNSHTLLVKALDEARAIVHDYRNYPNWDAADVVFGDMNEW